MAITESLGYGGSVLEDQVVQWGRSFGGTYGVLGAGDWKVTQKVGLDRTVGIADGVGFGHKVVDTNVGEVLVQLDTATSGTRYDLIVAHRDWFGTGGTTTFTKVTGTSVREAVLTARDRNPGVEDDQPIALVEVIGGVGGGVLGEVRDLRVWQGEGGAVAVDELVLQYLTDVGTSIRIGNDVLTRTFASGGVVTWSRTPVAGGWVAYTPTGVGFSGISLDRARWIRHGNMVTVQVAFTVQAVSGTVRVLLPVNAAASDLTAPVGIATAHNGTNTYTAPVFIASTTQVGFRWTDTGEFGPARPFTWASGNRLAFTATYEAA